MKNSKISKRLKAIDIILAISGFIIFAFTYHLYLFDLIEVANPSDDPLYFANNILNVILLTYIAIFAALILIKFWRVCTEIGNDNSFSKENGDSFKLMSIYGFAISIGFVIRFIWSFFYLYDNLTGIVGWIATIILGSTFLELLASFCFGVICQALSQLIYNAYEVKHENDFTI